MTLGMVIGFIILLVFFFIGDGFDESRIKKATINGAIAGVVAE